MGIPVRNGVAGSPGSVVAGKRRLRVSLQVISWLILYLV